MPRLRPHVRVSSIAMALISLGVLVACDEPPECYEGEYEACFCGEEPGFRACARASYGACVCNGDIPGLDGGLARGGDGAGGGGTGGGLPFLAPCDEDEQCETMLCHVFSAKGPKCSKTCSDASDCPPPSPGCNMMRVCKAP